MWILFAIQVLTGVWRAKRDDARRSGGNWNASDIPTTDPIAAEAMARALSTGRIVFANRMQDGSVEYSECDDDGETNEATAKSGSASDAKTDSAHDPNGR